jgi:capsular polysaccharide biosynthesis protein
MDENQNVTEIDLLQLARVLWQRAWIILIAALLAGASAFSYAYFLVTPLYKASAKMYVNNSTLSVGSTSVSLSDLTAAQSLVETYIVILQTRATLNDVIDAANLDYSYEELYEMISAASVNSTEVFEVIITSPDPHEAEKIANTIAILLPEKIANIVEGSSAKIVDFAVVPAQKSSPSLARYSAIGILIGALICGGIIILWELLDEQIRDDEFLRKTVDIPVLAAIPDLSENPKNESYQYYRVNPTENGGTDSAAKK